jgi:peptide/nickel transport system permease protein
VIILILIAIFAPVITAIIGHGPNTQYRHTGLSLSDIPVGPNSTFLLGADDFGRDLLSRLVYGARVSLFVGLVTTAGSLVIGVIVGLVAGFFGGALDTVLSRITDIFLSFPSLLFAISLVGVFGQSINLVVYIIIAVSWPVFMRITRGQVLSLREKEFVEAARSLGSGNLRIMFIDILPNLVAPLIVYSTLQIPVNIIYESTLSFLGLGVKIPTASWGDTLSAASAFYTVKPTFLLFPILALLITTLSFNILGDGLRDAFDPRAARTMAK